MNGEMILFPATVEEFMEQYKVVDRDHALSNGAEFVPVFRMRQWFDHLQALPITNADRIRSMTDEELAWFISCPEHNDWRTTCLKDDGCLTCRTKWLKQEAVDNGACSANETSEKVKNE